MENVSKSKNIVEIERKSFAIPVHYNNIIKVIGHVNLL